ncbi:MAG: hypothetical protein ACLSBG_07245 [Sellimonas intestinalis]|uniref:hypothetical protein n=1 Tax=Sellimonas intestinalis TaxID=1653434 RepID=UPI00399501A8
MSEEKQTVCGAISKVTSAQRDAERHHIVQVSFQEGTDPGDDHLFGREDFPL